MTRCAYPKCERIVRETNRYGLCHVHVDMADFFVWFSETLERMQQVATKGGTRGAAVRSSGLVVPQR